MTTQIILQRQNLVGEGRSQENINVNPLSKYEIDSIGNSLLVSKLCSFDYFELLPAAAVAAGSDKLVTLLGSNTPVVAQSATGGALYTTGATSGNESGIAAVAATGFSAPLTASNDLHFRARLNLPSLTTCLMAIGLGSLVTDIDPTAIAGDGVFFLADPTNADVAVTAATGAQALNWIVVYKVGGVKTVSFTNVPIVAAQDFEFHIVFGTDLKPLCYINEVLVATGPACTLNATLKVVGGVETLANTVATGIIRYAQVTRRIG